MADAKPSCRLYLQLPAPLTAKLEAQLAQALASTTAACVLLCDYGRPDDDANTDRVIDLVQAAGIACLIDNDIALAERLGADGVHLEADPALYRGAREQLGESASIGAGCGLSRHAAMALAEAGADYVAFGPDAGDIDGIDQCAELIAWWSEIFIVPCVAWNVDDAGQAAHLARLGADFVAPSRTIWQDDRAATIIAGIDNAIRSVRRAA
ncbi:MAG: thiamine phosphate synthase [Methyloceanibacter sp.]|uniref:thiamine phosphate synthase n=1 Tax=Methyloceanibacter sp. TaxID=1965321 RepID=UPI003D6D3AEE